jgi:hypothetical protein
MLQFKAFSVPGNLQNLQKSIIGQRKIQRSLLEGSRSDGNVVSDQKCDDDSEEHRVSMFLYYGKHSTDDRQIIWNYLLKPLILFNFTDECIAEFASYNLNAWEIRSVVQIARSLANCHGMMLNGHYIRKSLKIFVSSLDKLKKISDWDLGGDFVPSIIKVTEVVWVAARATERTRKVQTTYYTQS